jgi:hypothetical protein
MVTDGAVARPSARAHTVAMGATAKKVKAEGEKIVVYQSTDRSGATFALSPGSRNALQQHFGSAVQFAPRIFIAHDTRGDFERIHGGLAKQLLSLLTGLSAEAIADFSVEFRDPVTEQTL